MNDNTKINLLQLSIFSIGIFIVIYIKCNVGIEWDDYYWHYKMGEYIINNHSIPSTGIFSWYAQDMTWYYHEWLGGVLLYLLGGTHPIYIVILLNILFIGCLLLVTRKYIIKNWVFYNIILLLAIAIISLIGFTTPRPYLFTNFLLLFELYILFKFKENNNSKLIYIMPLLAILWTNLHSGSSIFIYLLPIFFILTSFKDINLYKLQFNKLSKSGILKLSIITIISTGCICINPYGYKMLLYPYNNVVDDIIMKIPEWQPPDFKEPITLLVVSLLIITVILMMISNNNINATDLLLLLFFTYIYLRSVRFATYLMILSLFIIFKYIKAAEFKINPKTTIYSSIIICICAICGSIIIFSLFGLNESKRERLEDICITDEAIQIIKENNPKHLYNNYHIGGQLVYNDIPVWLDGRADLYSGQYSGDNLRDFYIMKEANLNINGDWDIENIINKYDFDMFVCAKTECTQIYLKSHPELYTNIYSTDYIDVYKKV